MRRYLLINSVLGVLFVCLASFGRAEALVFDEIQDFSLEDLLNIEVSIASRKETPAFENPAAIYVITQSDIKASGIRALPELLRMVPGLHVSRINSRQWAVSSRSKTRRFSGYLLVAIDGRAVHNHIFGGVLWDMQHYPVQDIEKIEIVRGAGATTWGTNAVNGVINIISKNSKNTQSTVAALGAGSGDIKRDVFLRHGFKLGESYGRVYVSGLQVDSGDYGYLPNSNAGDANEESDINQVGFRFDYKQEDREFVLQGDAYQGETGEYDSTLGDEIVHFDEIGGYNILGRWHQKYHDFGESMFQLYIDHYQRSNGNMIEPLDKFEFNVDAVDVDFQHFFAQGSHHWAFGLGYRHLKISTEEQGLLDHFGVVTDPNGNIDELISAYIQDRIDFWQYRLQWLTGVKIEKNDYSGVEWQPSTRLIWHITEKQNLWVAYTRAVRSPVLNDDEVYVDDTGLAALDGSAVACEGAGQGSRFGWLILPEAGCVQNESLHADSQTVLSHELGYRWAVTNQSIDVAVFYDEYETQEFITDTNLEYLFGLEFSFNYHISEQWQMLLNYSRHQGQDKNIRTSERLTTEDISKNTAFFRLSYIPSRTWLFYANTYYVEEIDGPVPSYTRIDLQAQWRENQQFTVSIVGSNLLDNTHLEESTDLFDIQPSEVRRGVFVHF
ncbi:MAG: hypothetical protein COA99_16025, partial [Moraxellaceae bacterium]